MMLLAALLAAARLGAADAACRANEAGPALRVEVLGLKDRRGGLRLELYPADDDDFLADDTALTAAGKDFRRVDVAVPAQGPALLCIRAPRPGRYAVVLLHDRNADLKFEPLVDGVGFANDPRLGYAKPSAARASLQIGQAVSQVSIQLNYWNGLRLAPLKRD